MPPGTTVTWSGTADPGVTWYQVSNDAFVNFTAVGQMANLFVLMNNSCGSSGAKYRFKCTSASSCGIQPLIVAEKELLVMPNPATNNITIAIRPQKIGYTKSLAVAKSDNIKGILYIQEVEIYDAAGKLKLHKTFSGKHSQVQVDISLLPKGIYFVKVSDDKMSTTDKIVLQ